MGLKGGSAKLFYSITGQKRIPSSFRSQNIMVQEGAEQCNKYMYGCCCDNNDDNFIEEHNDGHDKKRWKLYRQYNIIHGNDNDNDDDDIYYSSYDF